MCSKPLRRLAVAEPVADSLSSWFAGSGDVVLGDIITTLPDTVSLMEVTGTTYSNAQGLLAQIASEVCPVSHTVSEMIHSALQCGCLSRLCRWLTK
jgi:hypothetical protein